MVAVSLKKKLKGDSSRTHEVGQSHPYRLACISLLLHLFFFFKQKTAYEIGLGIPAEPLFRSQLMEEQVIKMARNGNSIAQEVAEERGLYY